MQKAVLSRALSLPSLTYERVLMLLRRICLTLEYWRECRAFFRRVTSRGPHVSGVWEQTRGHIITSPNGYLLFADTVAGKNYSRSIELVRCVNISSIVSRIDAVIYRTMGASKNDRGPVESRLRITYQQSPYHQRTELSTKALEKQST
jgi:hypothetical protein